MHSLTRMIQILSLSLILVLLTRWHVAMLSDNTSGKLVPILSWQIYEFMPMGSKAAGCAPQMFDHIQAWRFVFP